MNHKNQSQRRSKVSLWVLVMVLCPFSLYFVDSSATQDVKFLAIAAVAAAMIFAWCMAENRMKKQSVDTDHSSKG